MAAKLTVSRGSIIICAVLLLIITIQFLLTIRLKCRSIFIYKLNEFYGSDIVTFS